MLRLELDWAGDEPRPEGPQDDEGHIEIELGEDSGPAGWPTVVVVAHGATGAEAGPRLWAWLRDEYAQDDEEASFLAGLADWA